MTKERLVRLLLDDSDALLLLDSKIDISTEGLTPQYGNRLRKTEPKMNAMIISKYIISMKAEINPSDRYREVVIKVLTKLSQFHNNSRNNDDTHGYTSKSLLEIRREDILRYLDTLRKPESVDPLHKWIGTYNIYRIHLIRFFKWLYYHDLEQDKRPKPAVVDNIPQLKRKEQSIYKPTDLWTEEDDILFLKYCPNKRDRCYHAMSRDSSCRPHELLKLRIKDIVFKVAGHYRYAEILVNGKTGSRHIPLINSIPYLKDWLDDHPYGGNPNAVFLCGTGRGLGRILQTTSLGQIYSHYKKNVFAKLLEDQSVPSEDKQKIRELLKKPWNPYIRRHSALTDKSKFLKEHILRQHSGWSPRSQMHLKYLHYFGNESSESLLQAYGIITTDCQQKDSLRPKQCPSCNEPNKPDSKFCAKCRMVLTYDAYTETIEEKEEKDKLIDVLAKKQEKFEQLIQSLIDSGQLKPNIQTQVN
jgi:integrase